MSTQPMMFPSKWSERMAYERAKAGYWPYDIEDLRHFCALRDLRIEELKADNAKLRELVDAYDSALSRLCDQSLNAVYCEGCVLGCGYTNDVCAMDALRRVACELGVEIQK